MLVGKVGFEGQEIDCIIGVNQQERVNEQKLIVDLFVEVNILKCVQKDEIAMAVDYETLFNLCKEMAITGKYQLIETYAYQVLQRICENFEILAANIRVQKPEALKGAKHSFVELRMEVS